MSRYVQGALLIALMVGVPAAAFDRKPVVGLNHLTLVPDSATFAAIAASPFLRDTFALVESSPDGVADRITLFGRSTYVEFRRPAGRSAWRSRVSLGTDERGALHRLAEHLTSELGGVRLDSLSRRRDSTDVPWLYQLVASESPGDPLLAVRVVEYHPHFLPGWYGATVGRESVSRADVLATYATQRGVEARFALRDVIAIKVAASEESAALLLAHCRGIGWRVQSATGGTACVGPGVRLFVMPSVSAPSAIVAFTMRVGPTRAARASVTRTFGQSTLRLSRNGLATWEFGQRQ